MPTTDLEIIKIVLHHQYANISRYQILAALSKLNYASKIGNKDNILLVQESLFKLCNIQIKDKNSNNLCFDEILGQDHCSYRRIDTKYLAASLLKNISKDNHFYKKAIMTLQYLYQSNTDVKMLSLGKLFSTYISEFERTEIWKQLCIKKIK